MSSFFALVAAFVAVCEARVPGFDDPVVYPPEVFPGDDVGGGELRVDGADEAGVSGALVLEESAILAEVNGGLARVALTQWFANPYDQPISATYLLPLPQNAAVDRMELVCGDRHVEGIVLERAAAKDLYEEARAEGRKAALLEQERTNLFTQSIANLCPGEEVELTVEWVEPVAYEDGVYSWAMPLTVGPRYTPPWVEDGGRLDTPYTRDGHAVDLTVVIDEGIPVSGLWSDTHDIVVDDEGPWGAEVSLEAGDSIPNRDFELSWGLAGTRPLAGLVTARPDPDELGWLALTVEPPELGPEFVARPRELVFVVDQSCSMEGESYDAAKAAVARALRGMRPNDTFNLVRFSDLADTLYGPSQASTPTTRAEAAAWLETFSGGGTEMERGLVEALDHPATPGALRLVVLLTDGFVGQDEEVLKLVKAHLGSSRIFGFGVSPSPNRALLSQLADVGRGAVIYHHPGRDVDEAVRTFEARIAHPAMTDLTVDWGGLRVSETYPSRIPDLWAGQPIRVFARYEARGDKGPVTARVSGMVGSRRVTLDLPVDVAPPDARHQAVISAWARAKIDDLGRRYAGATLRDAVTDVALDYGMVTRYTSLVAVDDEVAACGPAGVTVRVPNLSPAGLSPAMGGSGYGYGAGGSAYGYGTGRGYYGFSAKRGAGAATVGGDTIVLGGLDHTLLQAVIDRARNPIRYCYTKALQKDATLQGKVVVKFVIAADGSVASANIRESTLGSPDAEACVAAVFRRLTFPPVRGGGITVVNYPFVFRAAVPETPPAATSPLTTEPGAAAIRPAPRPLTDTPRDGVNVDPDDLVGDEPQESAPDAGTSAAEGPTSP